MRRYRRRKGRDAESCAAPRLILALAFGLLSVPAVKLHAGPECQAALERVANAVFSATAPVSTTVRWEVRVAAGLPTPTAESRSDGLIWVSAKLLDVLWRGESDDRLLAAVLAHEMGHVQLGHHLRCAEAAGRGLRGLTWQAFRRELEYEADTYACSILDRAGYDARAVPDMLTRLQESGEVLRDAAPPAEWATLDHPTLEKRVAYLAGHLGEATQTGELFNFAVMALRAGSTELARRCFAQLARPGYLPASAEVQHNLGLCEHIQYLHKAPAAVLGLLRPSLYPLQLTVRTPKSPPELEKHLQAAIRYYRRALELAPDYAATKSHLAVALSYLGDEAALDVAREASEMTTAGPAELNNLGFVLQRVGRVAEAVRCYDLACERSSPSCMYDSAVYNRALAYQELGEPLAAEKDWISFLVRCPRGRWADIARSQLTALKALTMSEEAAEEWVRTRFRQPAQPAGLRPPHQLDLWQSVREVTARVGDPAERRRFPRQDAELLRYKQPVMTLLFDRDRLVAVEAEGTVAEAWLEQQGADVTGDPEKAIKQVLGWPDMRRTESDGSRWLGYGSLGLMLFIRDADSPAKAQLELCSFIPPPDAFVQG